MDYFQPTYLSLLDKYQNAIKKNTTYDKIDIIKITNNEIFSNYIPDYKRKLIIILLFFLFFLILILRFF